MPPVGNIFPFNNKKFCHFLFPDTFRIQWTPPAVFNYIWCLPAKALLEKFHKVFCLFGFHPKRMKGKMQFLAHISMLSDKNFSLSSCSQIPWSFPHCIRAGLRAGMAPCLRGLLLFLSFHLFPALPDHLPPKKEKTLSVLSTGGSLEVQINNSPFNKWYWWELN